MMKATGTSIKIARETTINQKKKYNSVKNLKFKETTILILEDKYWD